jgi:phospholipid/cholesterol/gamma-HCH transport system substrate-binding protein
VTQAVDERRAQLASLITALKVVSTTLASKDRTILSLIDHLNPVLSNLAVRQQAIRRLLEATDLASHDTADLVARNRGVLDATLRGLHTDLAVLDRHQVDLAATIQYLDASVHGYQSVGYSQSSGGNTYHTSGGFPNRWANIFVQSLGPFGVDALLGQCGAVDQLVDQVLGTDCNKQPKGGAPRFPVPTGRGSVHLPGVPLPTPSLPGLPTPSVSAPSVPLPSVSPSPPPAKRPLPGNVGDIVKTALSGSGGGT